MSDVMAPDLNIPEALGGGTDGRVTSPAWLKMTFSLGGTGSGMMFHEHENAYTASFAGLKRWVIWDRDVLSRDPPPFQLSFDTENKKFFEKVYTTQSHERWLKKNGWECVQQPGELMYIPGRMQHLVLNIGETVAITGEYCAIGFGFETVPECQAIKEEHDQHMAQVDQFRQDRPNDVVTY